MTNSKIKQNNNSQKSIQGNISYKFLANSNLPFKRKNKTIYQNYTNNNYDYVIKDLKKTFLMSLFLIGLEIIIFILVKNNFVKIPVI